MKYFLLSFFSLSALFVSGQHCAHTYQFLNTRINSSENIVEGKVLDKTSVKLWADDLIYTLNKIEITRDFKGIDKGKTLWLITLGGTLYDERLEANPSLKLRKGEMGVFFLQKQQTMALNTSYEAYYIEDIKGVKELAVYAPSSGVASFIPYNRFKKTAVDQGVEYRDIENSLIREIESHTGQGKRMGELDYYKNLRPKNASIQSFSPDTTTSGAGQILTIRGSGFGNSIGQIGFSNADDGGKTYVIIDNPIYFKKWTDTEIEVYVPNGAGTGDFRVISSVGSSVTSSSDLTILYSRMEVVSAGPAGNNEHLYWPVLHDNNSNGGYNWVFNEDFIKNKGAVTAFMRALQNWRCSTAVNFNIDTTISTSVDTVGRDDIHTIMWQNQNQAISNGALGVAFSQWSGCYNSQTKNWKWFLKDIDLVFDDDLGSNSWNFGAGNPSSSEYDFESVALHELGHSHQLAHIIDKTGSMHYSIRNGEVKRSLKSSVDVAGGNNVLDSSMAAFNCGGRVDPAERIPSGSCKILDAVQFDLSFSLDKSRICENELLTLVNTSKPFDSVKFTWLLTSNATIVSDTVVADSQITKVSYVGAGNFFVGLKAEKDGSTDSLDQTRAVRVFEEIGVLGKKIEGVQCYNDENGSAEFIFNSGTAPYTIFWESLQKEGNPINGLDAGWQTYTITDANGCEVIDSVEISEPDSFYLVAKGSSATWGQLAKGKAWIEVAGGVQPYTYAWDDENNSKTDTARALDVGTYTVIVTDDNGCIVTEEIRVDEAVSVNENKTTGIQIFPNPFDNLIHLRADSEIESISIVNAQGQIVLFQKTGISNSELILNSHDLPKGVYFAELLLNGEKRHVRLLKH